MKNLFKNLMLVAVAAMAFTACSQDVNEVNNVERTVRYEFTANFSDDTRSGFAEETSTNDIGKTVYHSEWFGNETLFLVPNVGESTTAPISAEGKFSVDLSSNATQINIYSPASSWSDYGSYCLANVPAEQTSGVNSVDPKAHIVSGYAMVDANGNQTIPVTLSHAVAYGKMTVSGVDFAIDHVVVDLKGSFSSYDRECSYTVKANGVDNTFWFATEPIDVAEFTVTAYDAEDNAVTKTIDVAALENKTLSFNCGRVSTFSVSGLEEYVAFTRAYTGEYTSNYNDYYIWFEGPAGKLKTNPCNITTPDWVLTPGTYNVQAGGQCFYSGSYTALNDQYSDGGTVTVSVVNGMYHFDFNIILANGTVFTESYTGLVEGLNIPDLRTPLEMPNVTATVEGNIITLSWGVVSGAESYLVSCEVGGLEAISTSETSVSIEADYLKNYAFKVQAIALDSDPDFKSSDYCYVEVTTEADPNLVIPEFTTMTYVGTEDTYPDYGEYCHVFELTSSDNYKMNLYVGSYQASSTHIDVGEYHYEGKMNLGYEKAQWGFQAKVWNSDGSYLGLTSQNSEMVVKKSGDIYNIDFTLIIGGNIHFFDCNAAIGGNEPEPEPEPEPDPDQPTPGDGGVTIKYIKNYGSGYTYLRYYELTSGNDVIGFWMNNSNPSNTVMSNGTYKNNKNGISNVASSATTIHIDKSVIDGEINNSASNTSQMVVSNNGGHIEFKLDYWDTSVGSYVIREYVFDGTIQQ